MNGENINSENQIGSYFIDTNLNFTFPNNGAIHHGSVETGVDCKNQNHSSTSISFSNELYHSHFNSNMDFIQCVSSGDASIASSSESISTKLSLISGQEQSLSAMLISQGKNFNNNNNLQQSQTIVEDLEENLGYCKDPIRRGGRGKNCRGGGGGGGGDSFRKRQATSPDSKVDSTDNGSLNSGSQCKSKHGKALASNCVVAVTGRYISTGHPFIPSYMDPKSGPHLCAVCNHNASGFHYRVMACEGCKGFFRRTVQNSLKYSCKFSGACEILPHNRAQCQQCRWNKCLKVGMAQDLVLSDEARRAKKELIAANRAKRMVGNGKSQQQQSPLHHQHQQPPQSMLTIEVDDNCPVKKERQSNQLTEDGSLKVLLPEEEALIDQICFAFDEQCSITVGGGSNEAVSKSLYDANFHHILQSVVDFHVTSLIVKCDVIDEQNVHSVKYNYPVYYSCLAAVVEPIMRKLVRFGCLMPRFYELTLTDRVMLLQSAAFDLVCLHHMHNYDGGRQALRLSGPGSRLLLVGQSEARATKVTEPVFAFCRRVAAMEMDRTEIGLMAALALVTSDRLGLQETARVNALQDSLLALVDGYLRDNGRDNPPAHRQSELYATVLPELRTATNWHNQLVQAALFSYLGDGVSTPSSPATPGATSNSCHSNTDHNNSYHSNHLPVELLAIYQYYQLQSPGLQPMPQQPQSAVNYITHQSSPYHQFSSNSVPMSEGLFYSPLLSSPSPTFGVAHSSLPIYHHHSQQPQQHGSTQLTLYQSPMMMPQHHPHHPHPHPHPLHQQQQQRMKLPDLMSTSPDYYPPTNSDNNFDSNNNNATTSTGSNSQAPVYTISTLINKQQPLMRISNIDHTTALHPPILDPVFDITGNLMI